MSIALPASALRKPMRCATSWKMVTDMKVHPSVTTKKILAAVQRYNMSLDNPGICTACGFEQDGCEPDARKYLCEACGERTVYGAEELLMMLC